MKINVTILALSMSLLILLSNQSASALPSSGSKEVLVAGGYNRDIGTGSGNANLDVSYGSYIDQALEVGLRQQFNYTIQKETSDVWRAVTAPFVNYHLTALGQNQSIVPFLGGQLGAVWNDDDITGTIGPEGGFKFYMDNSTFLLARYQYQWFFEKFGDVNETQNSAHVGVLGLGFNWN